VSKAGERILRSIKQARAYARGEAVEGFVVHVPEEIDVRALRKKLDMTRNEFALRFGFEVAAVKEWEMRRRKPDRAARVLLKVIAHNPKAVERALAVA
jgi:putative transcriptional regulator